MAPVGPGVAAASQIASLAINFIPAFNAAAFKRAGGVAGAMGGVAAGKSFVENIQAALALGVDASQAGINTANSFTAGMQKTLSGQKMDLSTIFNVGDDVFKPLSVSMEAIIGKVPLLGGELQKIYGTIGQLGDASQKWLEVVSEVGNRWQEVSRVIAGQTADLSSIDGLTESVRNLFSVGANVRPNDVIASIGEVHTRLGLAGKELEQFSKTYSEANMLLGTTLNLDNVTGVMNAFEVDASKATETLTQLINIARDTGPDPGQLFNSLKQLGPAFVALGYSGPQMATIFSEFSKYNVPIDRLSFAFSGFIGKIEEAVQKGKFKDLKDGMNNVIGTANELLDMGKDDMALDLLNRWFGDKAGLNMFDALRRGIMLTADEMNQLVNAGVDPKFLEPLTQGINKTKSFTEQMGILQRQLESAFAPVGVAFNEMLGGTAGSLTTWLATNQGEVTQWAFDVTQSAIEVFSRVVEGFAKVLEIMKAPLEFVKDSVAFTTRLIADGIELGAKFFGDMEIAEAAGRLSDDLTKVMEFDISGPIGDIAKVMEELAGKAKSAIPAIEEAEKAPVYAANLRDAQKFINTDTNEASDALGGGKDGKLQWQTPDAEARRIITERLAEQGIRVFTDAAGAITGLTANTEEQAKAFQRLFENLSSGFSLQTPITVDGKPINPPAPEVPRKENKGIEEKSRDFGETPKVEAQIAPSAYAPKMDARQWLPDNVRPNKWTVNSDGVVGITSEANVVPVALKSPGELMDAMGVPSSLQGEDLVTAPTELKIEESRTDQRPSDLFDAMGVPAKFQGAENLTVPSAVTVEDAKTEKSVTEVMNSMGVPSDLQGAGGIIIPVSYNGTGGFSLAGVIPNSGSAGGVGQNVGPIVGTGEPYGMPLGTDTGGYGGPGQNKFPQWVLDLGAKFGVQPSTYAGHQEIGGLNRGIDWVGSVEAMDAFAKALVASRPSGLDQVIWQHPGTLEKIGLAGGKPVGPDLPDTTDPGYYARGKDDWVDHRNHVHTSFFGAVAVDPSAGSRNDFPDVMSASVSSPLLSQGGRVSIPLPGAGSPGRISIGPGVTPGTDLSTGGRVNIPAAPAGDESNSVWRDALKNPLAPVLEKLGLVDDLQSILDSAAAERTASGQNDPNEGNWSKALRALTEYSYFVDPITGERVQGQGGDGPITPAKNILKAAIDAARQTAKQGAAEAAGLAGSAAKAGDDGVHAFGSAQKVTPEVSEQLGKPALQAAGQPSSSGLIVSVGDEFAGFSKQALENVVAPLLKTLGPGTKLEKASLENYVLSALGNPNISQASAEVLKDVFKTMPKRDELGRFSKDTFSKSYAAVGDAIRQWEDVLRVEGKVAAEDMAVASAVKDGIRRSRALQIASPGSSEANVAITRVMESLLDDDMTKALMQQGVKLPAIATAVLGSMGYVGYGAWFADERNKRMAAGGGDDGGLPPALKDMFSGNGGAPEAKPNPPASPSDDEPKDETPSKPKTYEPPRAKGNPPSTSGGDDAPAAAGATPPGGTPPPAPPGTPPPGWTPPGGTPPVPPPPPGWVPPGYSPPGGYPGPAVSPFVPDPNQVPSAATPVPSPSQVLPAESPVPPAGPAQTVPPPAVVLPPAAAASAPPAPRWAWTEVEGGWGYMTDPGSGTTWWVPPGAPRPSLGSDGATAITSIPAGYEFRTVPSSDGSDVVVLSKKGSSDIAAPPAAPAASGPAPAFVPPPAVDPNTPPVPGQTNPAPPLPEARKPGEWGPMIGAPPPAMQQYMPPDTAWNPYTNPPPWAMPREDWVNWTADMADHAIKLQELDAASMQRNNDLIQARKDIDERLLVNYNLIKPIYDDMQRDLATGMDPETWRSREKKTVKEVTEQFNTASRELQAAENRYYTQYSQDYLKDQSDVVEKSKNWPSPPLQDQFSKVRPDGIAEGLGKGFVKGVMQSFGLDGTVFESPLNWAFTKIMTSLLNSGMGLLDWWNRQVRDPNKQLLYGDGTSAVGIGAPGGPGTSSVLGGVQGLIKGAIPGAPGIPNWWQNNLLPDGSPRTGGDPYPGAPVYPRSGPTAPSSVAANTTATTQSQAPDVISPSITAPGMNITVNGPVADLNKYMTQQAPQQMAEAARQSPPAVAATAAPPSSAVPG